MIANSIHCQILIEDCTKPWPYTNTIKLRLTIMNLLHTHTLVTLDFIQHSHNGGRVYSTTFYILYYNYSIWDDHICIMNNRSAYITYKLTLTRECSLIM